MRRDPEQVEPRHLTMLADLKDKCILEVGCGDGRLTWRYAADASSVIGIDPDPVRLSGAIASRPAALLDRVTFIQSYSETLPFRSQTFDGAILAWSL
jgi:ubiquinone/menaquinone biosynthesis C-methylase UbiE